MEGSTIEQVAAQLQKQGILKDTKKFLELCKTGKDFTSYSFVMTSPFFGTPVAAAQPRKFQMGVRFGF